MFSGFVQVSLDTNTSFKIFKASKKQAETPGAGDVEEPAAFSLPMFLFPPFKGS